MVWTNSQIKQQIAEMVQHFWRDTRRTKIERDVYDVVYVGQDRIHIVKGTPGIRRFRAW